MLRQGRRSRHRTQTGRGTLPFGGLTVASVSVPISERDGEGGGGQVSGTERSAPSHAAPFRYLGPPLLASGADIVARQDGFQAAWHGLVKKQQLHGPYSRRRSRAVPVRPDDHHKSRQQFVRPSKRRPRCPRPPAPGCGMTYAPDIRPSTLSTSGHCDPSIFMAEAFAQSAPDFSCRGKCAERNEANLPPRSD